MQYKQLSFIQDITLDGMVNSSIKLLKTFEEASIERNPVGYVVGYSGGKDSDVMLDIFKRSGVRFKVIHNLTTIDAPDTVYYIRKKFAQLEAEGIPCQIYYPQRSFWKLCKDKKMLPSRIARFCCKELKEIEIPELRFATHSFGVRRAESVNRNKYRNSIETRNNKGYSDNQIFHFDDAENIKITGHCYTNNYFIINPIAYYSDEMIWDYIADNKTEINPQYSCGYTRIGCIGCPMAGKHRVEEFLMYPKYKQNYIRLCDDILKIRKAEGLPNKYNFKSGEEYFEHWLRG